MESNIGSIFQTYSLFSLRVCLAVGQAQVSVMIVRYQVSNLHIICYLMIVPSVLSLLLPIYKVMN
jgi:hypothetical protein